MVQRSVNSDIAGIRMVSQAVAYVLRYAHWSRIRVRVPEIWLNCAVLLRRRHLLGVIGPVRLSIGIVSAIWSSDYRLIISGSAIFGVSRRDLSFSR